VAVAHTRLSPAAHLVPDPPTCRSVLCCACWPYLVDPSNFNHLQMPRRTRPCDFHHKRPPDQPNKRVYVLVCLNGYVCHSPAPGCVYITTPCADVAAACCCPCAPCLHLSSAHYPHSIGRNTPILVQHIMPAFHPVCRRSCCHGSVCPGCAWGTCACLPLLFLQPEGRHTNSTGHLAPSPL
jgi:hypothetical protein